MKAKICWGVIFIVLAFAMAYFSIVYYVKEKRIYLNLKPTKYYKLASINRRVRWNNY